MPLTPISSYLSEVTCHKAANCFMFRGNKIYLKNGKNILYSDRKHLYNKLTVEVAPVFISFNKNIVAIEKNKLLKVVLRMHTKAVSFIV